MLLVCEELLLLLYELLVCEPLLRLYELPLFFEALPEVTFAFPFVPCPGTTLRYWLLPPFCTAFCGLWFLSPASAFISGRLLLLFICVTLAGLLVTLPVLGLPAAFPLVAVTLPLPFSL